MTLSSHQRQCIFFIWKQKCLQAFQIRFRSVLIVMKSRDFRSRNYEVDGPMYYYIYVGELQATFCLSSYMYVCDITYILSPSDNYNMTDFFFLAFSYERHCTNNTGCFIICVTIKNCYGFFEYAKYIKDLHSLVADISKFCLMYNMINFNPPAELSGSV